MTDEPSATAGELDAAPEIDFWRYENDAELIDRARRFCAYWTGRRGANDALHAASFGPHDLQRILDILAALSAQPHRRPESERLAAAVQSLRSIMFIIGDEHPHTIYKPDGYEVWLRAAAREILRQSDAASLRAPAPDSEERVRLATDKADQWDAVQPMIAAMTDVIEEARKVVWVFSGSFGMTASPGDFRGVKNALEALAALTRPDTERTDHG
jgi:PAS domain-containing protein